MASMVLVGCSNSKQLHGPSLSKNSKPRFIDDISLAGNNTTAVNMSVIDQARKQAKGNTKEYNPAHSNILQLKYADLLRIVPQAITNMALYSFIDEWYGVRYQLGGNDKTGIDCSAFVQRLYENVFGTNIVRTAIQQFQLCKMQWNIDSLEEGDLVFFRTHGKRISHVGIYLANHFFVHASASHGVMISSLNEDYWTRKYAGAGQLPKQKG
jgi:lipoprotein Spr